MIIYDNKEYMSIIDLAEEYDVHSYEIEQIGEHIIFGDKQGDIVKGCWKINVNKETIEDMSLYTDMLFTNCFPTKEKAQEHFNRLINKERKRKQEIEDERNIIKNKIIARGLDINKYYYPAICPNCDSVYDAAANNAIIIDGDEFCCECYKKPTVPFFTRTLPYYYEGFPIRIYTFNTTEELYNIIKTHYLDKNEILVKSGEALMSLNINKKFWCVLGEINNFDINKLNLPVINYDIYNADDSINELNVIKLICGKDVVAKDIKKHN